jgi:hypothetical protein
VTYFSPFVPLRYGWSELRSSIAVALSFLLALSAAHAQAPSPALLNIQIVEGEGAVNNVRQRVAREPVVEVTDENHRPVAGAIVLFSAPRNGAGGTFPGGANTLSVTTDAQGRATASGFQPNKNHGSYEIQVTATYAGLTASKSISQVNAGPVLGLTAKVWIIIAIAAGAAAGGAVAATRGGGTATAPASSPTVITPGAPSVGGPH